MRLDNFDKQLRLRYRGFLPEVSSSSKLPWAYVVGFLPVLPRYVLRKFKQFVFGIGHSGVFFQERIVYLKELLVSKLIWSRGRLGRPIATSIVLLSSFLMFSFGELFSSTRLVSSQELHPDFLASTSDIIPQRNIALTSIPEDRKGSKAFTYTVQGGDTLSSIGAKFRISVDALKYVNNLTDASVLHVGDKLTIPPVTGLIHKVHPGDTLSSIARKYDVPAQAIADFNYILDTSKLAVGTELVIPGAKVPQRVIRPNSSTGGRPLAQLPQAKPSKDFCVWPSSVRIITQYFTWYHNGVDIANPHGTALPPLYACTSGVVTRAGWDPFGLGLHVRIDHGNGYETVYGHMSRIDVSYGQHVSRGQVIGIMGSTGRSTGPHVHFMVKVHGVPQNPLNYMH